ncbi:MAG TPA: thioesterase family protein [Anaerolineaceae bacterium]|nr:thioesterase family protein [Anaerolineaceae bacterium]
MGTFRFSTEIPIRYGDLDPQGHVNNSRYFTYIEQARLLYIKSLGLWDGENFLDLGLIVADAHIAYLAPLRLDQTVRVWARVVRLGNKSIAFEYELADSQTGQLCARGDSVMVTFDYHTGKAIPIPPHWREAISTYENIPSQP